jgi:hypothetical protein
LHLFTEFVVAPVPCGAGVVPSIDSSDSRSVETVLSWILKSEASAVRSHSEEKLLLFGTFAEPVVNGEVSVELKAGR